MRISVVVPVFNEDGGINRLIAHVSGLGRNNDTEIIVADGDPDGSTLSAIKGGNAIKVASKKGRGIQLNNGAAAASGDILLFLHADTFLPTDAFEEISSVMKGDRYAGGAFDLGIDSERTSLRIIECAASLRSRITRIPYGDQAIFIRRDVFAAIGGFRDFSIMEDVDLMRRLRKAGERITIIPRKVRTSPRRWEREGVVRCTVRNWSLIMLYMLGVNPDRLARFYR